MDTLTYNARFKHVVFADTLRRRWRYQPASWLPARRSIGGHSREEDGPRYDQEVMLRWMFGLAGLDVRAYRMETLRRRVPACLRAVRAQTPTEARTILRDHPALLRRAMDALTIGVTEFFRDAPVFEHLHRLLGQDLRGKSSLRVWSAGCSDGAELYSITMLLAERGLLAGAELVGTDCRENAARDAKQGRYTARSLRGALMHPHHATLIGRYLRSEGEYFQIDPGLSSRTRWYVSDILKQPNPGPWDILACRNMAIYLTSAANGALWQSLASLLGPGGFLLVGTSERLRLPGMRPICPGLYRRQSDHSF